MASSQQEAGIARKESNMLGCACWPVATESSRRRGGGGGGGAPAHRGTHTKLEREGKGAEPGSRQPAGSMRIQTWKPRCSAAERSSFAKSDSRNSPGSANACTAPRKHSISGFSTLGFRVYTASVAPLSQSSGQFTQSKQTAAGSRPQRPLASGTVPCKFWVFPFQQEHGVRWV